jgi:hypothetical protein
MNTSFNLECELNGNPAYWKKSPVPRIYNKTNVKLGLPCLFFGPEVLGIHLVRDFQSQIVKIKSNANSKAIFAAGLYFKEKRKVIKNGLGILR